jgi:hypothetical protein
LDAPSLIFYKTHKTCSSTVTGILWRFLCSTTCTVAAVVVVKDRIIYHIIFMMDMKIASCQRHPPPAEPGTSTVEIIPNKYYHPLELLVKVPLSQCGSIMQKASSKATTI